MDATKITEVRGRLIEKLDAYERISGAPKEIRIGKDLLDTCPQSEDLRNIVYPLFDLSLRKQGFLYLGSALNSDKLAFAKP